MQALPSLVQDFGVGVQRPLRAEWSLSCELVAPVVAGSSDVTWLRGGNFAGQAGTSDSHFGRREQVVMEEGPCFNHRGVSDV